MIRVDRHVSQMFNRQSASVRKCPQHSRKRKARVGHQRTGRHTFCIVLLKRLPVERDGQSRRSQLQIHVATLTLPQQAHRTEHQQAPGFPGCGATGRGPWT